MKSSDVLLALAGLLIMAADSDTIYDDEEVNEGIPSPLLVEPYGGTFKLIVGIGIPILLPGRSLTYGQNMQFQYALPTNASFFTNLFSSSSRRRRRSYPSYERALAYTVFEQHFDRNGIDGKECMMRSICEAAETPLHEEGLVGELLHLLLTPDYGGDIFVDEDYVKAKEAGLAGEDCMELYPGCPHGHGILDHVSTVEYVK